MKTSVFCINCKHLACQLKGCKTYSCTEGPQVSTDAIHYYIDYATCDAKNANNDCNKYQPNFLCRVYEFFTRKQYVHLNNKENTDASDSN